MAGKQKRPSWFKMFLHQKALIDSVPDEAAGKALKAVFQYFETGELKDLDPLSFAVFSAIRPYIDESFNDYQRSVDAGRSGGNKRWAKEQDDSPTKAPHSTPIAPHSTPIAPLSSPLGVSTEAEADADAEKDGEADRASKSPQRTRFVPPTVHEVRSFCLENGYAIDPERFVDYYAANGWMAGKNKMKDWKAAVRNWNRRENSKNGTSELGYSINCGQEL